MTILKVFNREPKKTFLSISKIEVNEIGFKTSYHTDKNQTKIMFKPFKI